MTLLHDQSHRSAAYLGERHREAAYLQYQCRNFPRMRTWKTPSYTLDCDARTVSMLPERQSKPLVWDSDDDGSVAAYRPRPVTYFITILSAADRGRARDRLRRGWLRMFRGHPDSGWDYGFFLGDDGLSSMSTGPTQMRGDVVPLAVPDDYPHLGQKVLAALQWALNHVETKYILKADEDTWVHVDRLTSWLHDLAANPAGGWYGGMAVRATVERTGKWAVASDQYAASEYPPYAKGGGYVLSRTAAARIVDAIRSGLSPLLSNVEDATIGLAAVALNISLTHIAGFQELPPEYTQMDPTALMEDCCTVDTMLYHKPYEPAVCDVCWGAAGGQPWARALRKRALSASASCECDPLLSPSLSP